MVRSVLRRLVLAALVAAVSGCSGAGRQLISTGISSYDRQIILDAHNRLRQSVALGRVAGQPGAANMMQMVWDDELAAKAQQWADTCAHGHDSGRHVARFKVGQNIARSWTWPRPDASGGASEFARQIQNWFNEVSGYRYHGASAAGTGHYSQLIWGDSYLVGCGYSYFQDPAQGYTKLYVCNYGPGGNIRGYTPYQSGSPSCESFGSTPSSEYAGLCYPPGRGGSGGYASTNYASSGLSSHSFGTGVSSNNFGGSSHNYGSSSLGHSFGTGLSSHSFGTGLSSNSFGTSGLGSHSFSSNSLGSNNFGSSPSFGSHGLNSYSSSYDSNSLGSSGFSSNGLSSYGGYTSSPLSSYTSSGFGSGGFSGSGFGSGIFGSSGYNGFSSLGSSFDNNLFGGSRGYWKK